MNPEGLKVLAERASSVEGRASTRLDEVHARIAQARRRRQAGAIGAAVVAVVLALSVGLAFVALTETDHTPPAVPAPRPSVTPHAPEENAESVRLLTYADGHTIHWGDRAIDVGSTVQGLSATDDGVVFVRGDQSCPYGDACRTLWFTDGSDPVRLGMVTGSRIRGFGVDLATAGSTVLWAEPKPKDKSNPYYPEINEYVVYDTRAQREVARFGSNGRDPDRDGHEHLVIQAVFDDYVYWTPDDRAEEWCLDYRKYYGVCRRFASVMRLDTSTGEQTKLAWSAYISDRLSRPRLFFGPTDRRDLPYNPFPANRPGAEAVGFGRQGDRLVAGDLGGVPVIARLGRSGPEVRLRLPAGYRGDVESFRFQMWLDDDRFAIVADNREDILICRLSAGRCRVAVQGPTDYGFGGHG